MSLPPNLAHPCQTPLAPLGVSLAGFFISPIALSKNLTTVKKIADFLNPAINEIKEIALAQRLHCIRHECSTYVV